MASVSKCVSLLCLSLTLVISGSITLASVNVFQSQDQSVCSGMKATLSCVTTTTSGFLEWQINDVAVFTVTSAQSPGFSQTINGSEFVFVQGVSQFTVNIYTSTVSLNTNETTSIRCSDSLARPLVTPSLVVVSHISDVSQNNDNYPVSVPVSWSPPVDDDNDEICCVQYNVVTSNGTTENTTARSFTLYNVDENSFILIRCMDQIGTMGPPVMYGLVAPPTEPSPSASSSMIETVTMTEKVTVTKTMSVVPTTTSAPIQGVCLSSGGLAVIIAIIVVLAVCLAVCIIVIIIIAIKKYKQKPKAVISNDQSVQLAIDKKRVEAEL